MENVKDPNELLWLGIRLYGIKTIWKRGYPLFFKWKEFENMSNGLNTNKGFADYQKRLSNNKDVIVENFCKGLARYNIDPRRIDKLIVERKVGIIFVYNTITIEKNGARKEIYSKTATSYRETEVLRDKLKRRIIEEGLGVTITYKVEREFKITETWEIDCTGIK